MKKVKLTIASFVLAATVIGTFLSWDAKAQSNIPCSQKEAGVKKCRNTNQIICCLIDGTNPPLYRYNDFN